MDEHFRNDKDNDQPLNNVDDGIRDIRHTIHALTTVDQDGEEER